MAIVRRSHPSHLIVIGKGDEHGHLTSLIRELSLESYVRLIRERTNPYKFMSKADALVVTSRWEGFCVVIVEALALGIPVISTDCPSGPGEILDGGRYGRLVPVGDSVALASANSDLIRGDVAFPPAVLRQRAACFGLNDTLPPYLRLLGEVTE